LQGKGQRNFEGRNLKVRNLEGRNVEGRNLEGGTGAGKELWAGRNRHGKARAIIPTPNLT
jgi:hypothetical protein